MNITKKEFKKLKQLDKIEYMLRYKNLNDAKPSIFDGVYRVVMDFFLMGLILFSIGLNTWLNQSLTIINLSFKVMVYGFILAVIYVIANLILRNKINKRLLDLDKEFFNIKPKK
jgi:ABC-type uncharacterized transport system fused permease/ATPase subunit